MALIESLIAPLFSTLSRTLSGLPFGGASGGVVTALLHTFTAADSATAIPAADSGQATVSLRGGPFGIVGNRAYCAVDGVPNENSVGWNAGVADGTVSCVMATTGSGGWRMVWRHTDGQNGFMVLFAGANTWNYYRMQAGAYNQLGSFTYTPTAGDVVSVVLSGGSHTGKINGSTMFTLTDTFNQTATIHGIGASGAGQGSLFDTLQVTVP